MKWANSEILYLLLLIPVLWIMTGFSSRSRKKAFSRFAEKKFYNFFFQQFSYFHWNMKNVLLTLAVVFLILAGARPQWGKHVSTLTKEGIDIVVCLDTSISMNATDIQPSRIIRAKDQISEFIENLKGDRIAIVPFAGISYVQCPLTSDYNAAKLLLGFIDTDSVPVAGTDIGAALRKAHSLFQADQKYKVVVLISDGEDLEESALKTANELAQKGIIIYTLGVGSPQGAPIPEKNNGNIEYVKDSDGNIVMTKLDVNTLSRLASIGDGKFYAVTPQQTEIAEMLRSINRIEKSKLDSKQFTNYKDQYHYFLLTALALLLLEQLIGYRKKIKKERVLIQD